MKLPLRRSEGDELKPPAFLKIRSARWFIFVVVGFAIFTDIFLYGIVVPVLPFALDSRVGVAPGDVQHWVSIMLAVYAIGLLVTSPLWGYLADHASSRSLSFLLGLIALVLATVLLMLGSSIAVIVVGRLLQGMSAALVWTVGLAIISDTVGVDRVGEAMGWVTMGVGVGVFLGPLLGGVVFAQAGYYAVFGMAIGVVVIDIILRLLMIETKAAAKYATWSHTDEDEHVPSTDEGEHVPPTESKSVEPAANPEPPATDKEAGQDTTEQTPTPPAKKKVPSFVTLLKSPRLLVALIGCLVQAALLSSFDSVLPLYVAKIFHWDSLGAGLIFIPLVFASFSEPMIGRLSDKYGVQIMAVSGFVMTLPFFVLLRFVTYDSLQQKALLCALLFLVGVTVSFVLPPLVGEITRIVIDKEKEDPDIFGGKSAFAQAYSLLNMAFAGGTAIGPLWGGFVNQEAGWGTMCWSLGLFSAVTAIPVYIWTSPPPKRNRETGEQEPTVGAETV